MALTGFLFDGYCYAEKQQAADMYASKFRATFSPGDNTYVHNLVRQSDGSLYSYVFYRDSVGVVHNVWGSTFTPTFAPCDPTQSFFDGITVGWGLAAAIILAASIRLMRRAF